MKKVLLEIINWTWCFPQTFLGLILKLIYKGKRKTYQYFDEEYTCYVWSNKSGSISLGKYILLCDEHKHNIKVIKHEYGHYIQSLMLGWLYLIIIGLPSVIWANCFVKYRARRKKSYYDFYTESWANKLGGV